MSRRPRRPHRALTHARIGVVMILICAVMSVFGVRLLQLQGLDPKAYAARAEADSLQTVTLPAKRGAIVDRNGEPMAQSVEGLMLIADPLTTAPKATAIAQLLAERLGVDYFDTLAKLRKEGSRFAYLARRVPSTQAQAVLDELAERELAGVYSEPDPLRAYPADDVAANLLGFLGERDEDGKERPLAGLELAFNEHLSGTDGSETFEVGGGNRIPLGDNSLVRPEDGADLELTIDRDVQWYLQRVLRNAVLGARGESGSAVVMSTETGEVLGLADYPSYDANHPERSPKADLGSRAISEIYEPGSVQKVLTFAGLMDAGKVSPSTRLTVPGELEVQDRTIGDWFDHGRLRLTTTGVLAKSSNVGTVLSAEQMGPEQMRGYLTDFGLTRRTGVGLGGEAAGTIPDWETWSKVSRATISYGQGMNVTTLQMASAINAIANGGEYVSPSLIRGSATTDGGDEVGTDTSERRQVVKPQVAKDLAQMMEAVTAPEGGTAPSASITGYRVAGKTGTANRVSAECGCYDDTFTISFAGFVPADDPKFTIYFVIQNPRADVGGGSAGGPAFKEIGGYVLSRYGVAPTGAPAARLPLEW